MEYVLRIEITRRSIFLLGLFALLFNDRAFSQTQPERINAIYASLAGDHAALYAAQELGLFRK